MYLVYQRKMGNIGVMLLKLGTSNVPEGRHKIIKVAGTSFLARRVGLTIVRHARKTRA